MKRFGLGVVLLLSSLSASRADTLTYTGSDFTFATNTIAGPVQFTTSDQFSFSISGFTAAPNEHISLLGWTDFTASLGGLIFFALPYSNSFITLDANSQVASWNVTLGGSDPNIGWETVVQSCSYSTCNQFATFAYYQDTGDFAYTNGMRFGDNYGGTATLGTWELTVASAVPEPSTWAMMLLGFAGVGFMAYSRSRKDQGLALAAA